MIEKRRIALHIYCLRILFKSDKIKKRHISLKFQLCIKFVLILQIHSEYLSMSGTAITQCCMLSYFYILSTIHFVWLLHVEILECGTNEF